MTAQADVGDVHSVVDGQVFLQMQALADGSVLVKRNPKMRHLGNDWGMWVRDLLLRYGRSNPTNLRFGIRLNGRNQPTIWVESGRCNQQQLMLLIANLTAEVRPLPSGALFRDKYTESRSRISWDVAEHLDATRVGQVVSEIRRQLPHGSRLELRQPLVEDNAGRHIILRPRLTLTGNFSHHARTTLTLSQMASLVEYHFGLLQLEHQATSAVRPTCPRHMA